MAVLKITGQSAEPTVTSSDAGTLYYDTDTNKLRHYNGSAWGDAAGTVLQMVLDTSTTGEIHNGAWADWAGLIASLTTKAANSKFLILLTSGMSGYGSSVWSVDYKRIAGGVTTLEIGTAEHSTGSNYGITKNEWVQADWHTFNVNYVDAPAQAAGTAISYTPRTYSSGSMYFLHSSSVATLVVLEIAA